MCTIIYYVKQLVLLFFIFIISVCSTQDPWRVSGSMSNNTKKKIIRKAFFFRKNIFQLKYLIFLFFIFLPRVIIRNHFSDLLPVCCCALFLIYFSLIYDSENAMNLGYVKCVTKIWIILIDMTLECPHNWVAVKQKNRTLQAKRCLVKHETGKGSLVVRQGKN